MKKLTLFLTLILMSFTALSQEVVVQLDKSYGVAGAYDGAHNTIQHPDGGYLIYGTSAGFSDDNTFDFYLVKTDDQGNEQWSKTFDTDDNSIIQVYSDNPFVLPEGPRNNQLSIYAYGNQMLLTQDNHIIISGSSVYGASGLDRRSLPFLAKLDLDGNIIWQKLYQGRFKIRTVESITELNDGGILLTNHDTQGGNSASWIKIDTNGDFVWRNNVDTIGTDGSGVLFPNVSLTLDNGNIGAVVYDQNAGIRTFILELDPLTGAVISIKKIRDDGHDIWAHDFVKISDGYLLIGASSTTFNTTVVSKIDNDLNLVWNKTYNDVPELSNSRGYDGVELPDGSYSIVGYKGNDALYLLNVSNEDGSVNYLETFNDQYNIGYSIDLAADGGMLISQTYYAGDGLGLPVYDMSFIKTKGIENISYISGKAYFDGNENCEFDVEDDVLANALVLAQSPNGEIYQTRTDNQGNYKLLLAPATYDISIVDNFNDNQEFTINDDCNEDSTTIIAVRGQELTNIDFSFARPPLPPGGVPCNVSLVDTFSPPSAEVCIQQDGSIGVYTTPCPGQPFTYCISYQNTGTFPILPNATLDVSLPTFQDGSATVTSTDDALFTFVEHQVVPVAMSDLTITTGTAIPVNGEITYCITIVMDTNNDGPYFLQLDAVNGGVVCTRDSPDPIQDSCACDPNDMQVSPKGCGEFGNVSKDDTLTYTIRFENIGPGRAKDVFITNPLDSDLDVSSINLLNASHEVTNFQVNPNNDLLIRFEDILLNPIQEAPLNKGFVTFSVQPKLGLADGTVITNQASIVFDTNEPFVTNEVLNTLYDDPSVISSFSLEKQCESYGFDYDFTYEGNTSNATFMWDFGVNATPQTSSEANPSGIVFDEGSHEVTLTVTKNGCSDSSSQLLSVSDVASVGKKKVIVCHNGNAITINENALQAHLNHGDCVGSCEENLKANIAQDRTEIPSGSNELKLYPNPVTNTLNITVNSNQNYNSLKIKDLYGREIMVKDVHNKTKITLNISSLPKGVYFISLQFSDGEDVTKRILKK